MVREPLEAVGGTPTYLSGRRSIADVLALEKEVYLSEAGAVSVVAAPTLGHEVVHLPGAGGGAGQAALSTVVQMPMAAILHHLLAAQLCEGLVGAKGQNLPQGHAERPHVALGRVFALKHTSYDETTFGDK